MMLKDKLNSLNSRQTIKDIGFYLLAFLLWLFVCGYSYEEIPNISLIFSVLTGLSILAALVFIKRANDEIFPMAFVLGLLGCFYLIMLKTPPDEPAHFMRAFEISTGGIFSKPLSNGQFGDVLPRAISDCWNFSAKLDWSDKAEMGFTNTALYSFVNYIPQTIGILIARIFTKNVVVIHYAGRMSNFFAAFALSIFALKKIPFSKKILFLIMIFPVALQEMTSASPDALLNALSFSFIAFILNCAYQKEKVETKDIVLICIMLCIISLCKIVYLGMFFLVYIIPNKKLSKRNLYLLRIFIPVFAILLNFSSLLISMGILSKTKIAESNSSEQVKFILSHPFSYAKIFIKSIFVHIEGWIEGCVGSKLSLDIIHPPYISWGLLSLVFMGVSFSCNDVEVSVRKTDVIFFLLNFLAGFVLVLTSEYVGWTAPHSKVIAGVRGRYFIPVLLSLILPFVYKNYFDRIKSGNFNAIKVRSNFLFILVLVLNFIALVSVFKASY